MNSIIGSLNRDRPRVSRPMSAAQIASEAKVIRKYQPADCEGVLRVWAQASALAHPFLSEDFLELERHNIPNIYLPQAETWGWVADGQVVGFISLLGNEVGAIFVAPQFHRSGIGRALMERAQALRGDLEVEVFTSNRLGTAFYAMLGFERVALRRAGWDIRIHERATSPRDLGFGVGLAPNALSALHELGVAERVVRAGARLSTIECRYTNGRVIRRLNLPVGLPSVVALRPDLHAALLVAVGAEPRKVSSEAVAFSDSSRGAQPAARTRRRSPSVA